MSEQDNDFKQKNVHKLLKLLMEMKISPKEQLEIVSNLRDKTIEEKEIIAQEIMNALKERQREAYDSSRNG